MIRLFLTAQQVDVDDNNCEGDDPIQRAMGQFGKWHVFVCATVFLLKFPVAWHQVIKTGAMIPSFTEDKLFFFNYFID